MTRSLTRRKLLDLLSVALAQRLGAAEPKVGKPARRVVLVTTGGIRRQESFSPGGLIHVPRLHGELLPQALFYPYTINEGVTSHFNTISSILTGVWQHVDDWGGQRPADPTMFHYLQSQLKVGANETWVVTSNKQLTANISPGVNVILSKQLMIEAVERILGGQSTRKRLEREQMLEEMKAVLETDYERIGFGMASTSTFQDPAVKQTMLAALTSFIHGPDAPATGDELTYLVGREVLGRLEPALLMINFSDMEVAHSGSYSLHLGGIRKADALCGKLWAYIQASERLKETTTLVIMNEFGRDPDGASTNGFFNHRTNTESCRMAWTMVLGPAVRKAQVVERVIRQIDMAPSIGAWMGFECERSVGRVLPEMKV